MNSSATLENSRMLASVLGIGESEAESLLVGNVLLTVDGSEPAGKLADKVERMLKKTFTKVKRDMELGDPTEVEVTFGNCLPRSEARLVIVAISERTVTVGSSSHVRPSSVRSVYHAT